jgi:hypothetical protein
MSADGPFIGYRLGAVNAPLRVRNLSVDGCLVEFDEEVTIGRRISLQINLPGEGWTPVKAHALRVRDSSWFALTFLAVDYATRLRLTRAIHRAAAGRELGMDRRAIAL